MKRAVFLGMCLAILLLRVNLLQGQEYVMTDGQTVTVNCSQSQVHFYDPGGPDGNYEDNSDFTQTFVSSVADRCLQVTFDSIILESTYDRLIIYDGTSASGFVLGSFSGTHSNVTITSYSGALTFKFTSDGSLAKAGWSATISCVECPPPPPPGYNLHDGTDTLDCSQTPFYFYDSGGMYGDYENSSNITQTIVSSDPDKCLQVTFINMSLESNYDKLYVFDGTSTSGFVLGSFSGTDSNVTITSYSGALTFKFTSDGSVAKEGWTATISCVECPPPLPPSVIMHSGSLTFDCPQSPMPFYDNGGPFGDYLDYTNDTLVIRPSANGCMLSLMGKYNTESAYYDYIKIYSGVGTSGTLLASLGGNDSLTTPII